MSEPTLCENCDFVEPGSRKGNPYGWLCTRFPRLEGMGFVAPKFWAEKEPFMKCSGINGGKCATYKPRRTPQMELDT